MKKITSTFSLLLSAAMIFSCQNSDKNVVDPNVPTGDAFVSLTISSPAQTRADGDVVAGSDAENKITDVALLTFDSKHNFIANYVSTPADLSTSAATGNTVFNCAVASDAVRFFVITNYKACPKIEEAMFNMSGAGTAANALYEALTLTEAEVAAMATDGNFVMVNAGAFVNEVDVPLVSLPEGEVLSADKDKPTLVKIPVDRLLAKFNYTVADDLALPNAGDYGRVEGVKLHATNTKTFAYSKINTTALTNGADYRIDPNMHLDAETAETELNWLKNARDEEKFNPTSFTEYVLENTALGAQYNYNNLTQAVVKVVYTPGGIDLAEGESWFSIHIAEKGDIEMNFETLVKYYKNELDAEKYGVVDATIQGNLDQQLNHILSFSEDADIKAAAAANSLTWASTSVTLAVLDAVEFGGYRAATAPGYFIKYYQNSINYYDIFIQHDEMIEPSHLGRWGMVRNNAYTMNIKSIKAAGLPYIPSPFDPEIIDPENPNPEIPEPADDLDAFIDAEIVVQGWTIWSQDTDLM